MNRKESSNSKVLFLCYALQWRTGRKGGAWSLGPAKQYRSKGSEFKMTRKTRTVIYGRLISLVDGACSAADSQAGRVSFRDPAPAADGMGMCSRLHELLED